MNGARPFSREAGTWTQGYESAMRKARRDARVEAFAAIRRAETLARMYESHAERIEQTVHDPNKERWDLREGTLATINGEMVQVFGWSVGELESAALCVRTAIRAAIGSEKK